MKPPKDDLTDDNITQNYGRITAWNIEDEWLITKREHEYHLPPMWYVRKIGTENVRQSENLNEAINKFKSGETNEE